MMAVIMKFRFLNRAADRVASGTIYMLIAVIRALAAFHNRDLDPADAAAMCESHPRVSSSGTNAIASEIKATAKTISRLLSYSAGIRPSFRGADLVVTAAAALVMIGKGLDTPEAVHSYLANRDCPHDLPTVRFLLDVFGGDNPDQALWRRTSIGRYTILGHALIKWLVLSVSW